MFQDCWSVMSKRIFGRVFPLVIREIVGLPARAGPTAPVDTALINRRRVSRKDEQSDILDMGHLFIELPLRGTLFHVESLLLHDKTSIFRC